MVRLTRKEFLGLLAGRVRLAPAPDEAPGDPGPADQPDALLADFPAGLLAEEARRLGLDPQGLDRAAMLAAVRRAMFEQATPRTAATDQDATTDRTAEEAARQEFLTPVQAAKAFRTFHTPKRREGT